ncbi:MAG: hypothetical protein QOE28_2757 [Solirubrobacteraceae bacterium]|nr:hypothetical protein [Solirubrobacteraceae bacterium]
MRPVRAAARLAAPPWGGLAAGAAVAAALAIAAGSGHRDARVSPSSGAARPASARATAGAGVTAATPERQRRRVALIGGKALQSARCVQWKRGTARQRAAIVSTLQVVVGGPTPFGRANTLPPGEATALFDRACSRYYARSFLLYELYTRASAFHGPPPPKL